MRTTHAEHGFALISVFFMAALFLAMLGVYYSTSATEMATVRYSKGSSSGFYASEGGLNIRAETIRAIFVGFNRPSGTSPADLNACTTGNMGAGDYACQQHNFNNRTVNTFIAEDASNPVSLTIPPGERYQNLNAQEYRYTAKSRAQNNLNVTEAELQLRFKSRLVPLFQFAAFYNKDLEILPGPVMTLAGPVHTNGDLYVYSNSASLTINGQVTTAGDLWRGRKDGSVAPSCNNNPVNIYDPLAARALIPVCAARRKVLASDIPPWNGMIQVRVPAVTVPGPDVFDPTPGKIYWDKADLRLVLTVDGANNPLAMQVRNPDDTVNAGASATVTACAGIASGRAVNNTSIYNFREARWIRILDVDMRGLLNCLHSSNWYGTGKQLNDSTEGGIVLHLTVKGPNSALRPNAYGARVRNAARLQSNVGGAPVVRGMTIVSDQAMYLWGDFNSLGKIPAAVMSDTINVLSNAWADANSNAAIGSRVASNTIINSAFLAGTDVTGGTEGAGGQGGAYNGGLENYPRFHENWSAKTFTYRGSFVSLGTPQHVSGAWAAQSYNPPNRDWNYDTSFNNAANLPPITPRFVYLRQELFIRDFERD